MSGWDAQIQAGKVDAEFAVYSFVASNPISRDFEIECRTGSGFSSRQRPDHSTVAEAASFLLYESEAASFLLYESEAGSFLLYESEAGSFSLQESEAGSFSLQESEAGSFCYGSFARRIAAINGKRYSRRRR